MATKQKPGKKHTLLLYQRTMNRIWPITMLLAGLLFSIWAIASFTDLQVLHNQNNFLLLTAGVCSLGLSLFALLTRNMAYVQANVDHIKLNTPFMRINISYRRMRTVHPSTIMQLFPAGKLGWTDRNFLEPFFNSTALILELRSYPVKPWLLRALLPRQMFPPHVRGLVFLVQDWMALSTEIDSMSGVWLQLQARRKPQQDQDSSLGGGRRW